LIGNLVILAVILICGYAGQSLIKIGLREVGGFSFRSVGAAVRFYVSCLHNPYVWMGFVCVGIGFAMWLAFFSRLDFSQALLMIAISYLPLLLVGRFVFHEKIGSLRILGAILITVGVICVGLGKPK